MNILAIDQGTTSTRALVVEPSGSHRIVKAIEHKQHYPAHGWVEHNPEELIQNIQICIDAGCKNSSSNIAAIGLDNQGESCLAWNADTKQAVSPVIVWQDNRTQATIDKLIAEGRQDWVLDKAGLPLDSYFSASKLAWILENIPEAKTLQQQGKLRLGTTDAFFLDRLTNHFVTDITTASRTSLMNLNTGQWDEELCKLFAVPIESLPEIVATTGNFGTITSNGKEIPVTASVVDQQAALFGHGCRNAGDAKITFGTGAFALVVTGDRPLKSPEQGLLPTVAWQLQNSTPVYALDGGVYSAGSAINWAKSLGLFKNFAQINQYSQSTAIERGLVFVPALSGLGCPHWDRRAGGLWLGLSLNTEPADMMQSILEGIAFRAAEVITAMDLITPIGDKISIDGGVSLNPYFGQFLANVLNRQVAVKPFTELTAMGTARLAGQNIQATDIITGSSQCYSPKAINSYLTDKFTDAVSRAKNWHI